VAEQQLPAKCVAESRVQLSMMMNPEHANPHGNVHGGVIMKLADEAGALAAMRHSASTVVTVAIDSMSFDEPILVGNVVMLTAEMTYTGRTSMEVRVAVVAEDPLSGTRVHTNIAYFVYVAIDREGRPRPVPPLCLETPEEELRFEQAKERQAERKRRSQREQVLRDHVTKRDDLGR
jgi:uncharacterized protein (TIGR00369 family)